MTPSSTSSSIERALRVLLVAAVIAVAGCAGSRPAPSADVPPLRIAILPPHNVSGGMVATQDLMADLERALTSSGVALASGDAVEEFLTLRRIRFTGGVDRDDAADARDALGVDALLVATVERYAEAPVPQFALTLRLVAASKEAEILWTDGASLAGDQSPGLLGLGIVKDVRVLQRRVVSSCVRSLQAYTSGRGYDAGACDRGRIAPRRTFRSQRLEEKPRWTVAVLPFVNDTDRRDAGEAVASLLLRELASSGRFRVYEPGVVRRLLLGLRVVQDEGVSLEEARLLTQMLGADLVIAGRVYAFFDNPSIAEAPRAEFSVTAIHRGDKQTFFKSYSYARGDDGLHLFGFGRIATAETLTCRMASAVVRQLASP